MPDWLTIWLGLTEGGIIRTLAGELRTGGAAAAWLAFALGALHALTLAMAKQRLRPTF